MCTHWYKYAAASDAVKMELAAVLFPATPFKTICCCYLGNNGKRA